MVEGSSRDLISKARDDAFIRCSLWHCPCAVRKGLAEEWKRKRMSKRVGSASFAFEVFCLFGINALQ